MGLRGPGAICADRKPHKNSRPNARARAQMVEFESRGYWDLVNGTPEHWSDRFDRQRERAWHEWCDRIFLRWPKRYGWRADGWWSFDFPALLCRAWQSGQFSEAQTDAMTPAELVFHLDASTAERTQIESQWRKGIANARWRNPGADLSVLKREAVTKWNVPTWFFDREAPQHCGVYS